MTASPDHLRPDHLWVDATAGVAGDMLLGALLDLDVPGVDLAAVQAHVDAVLPGTVRLEATEVTRAGLRARKLDVRVLAEDQPHRTWAAIRDALTAASLPEPVRDAALAAFGRLAEAEARVHGVPPDDVHFHEVGAWDSVADVVGVCAAVHLLGVRAVSASPVALGAGRGRGAHGDLPLPAPATLELARGWTVRSGPVSDTELATPTGMALLRALAPACEDLPALVVDRIGVGAGTKDFPGRANVVRVVLGRSVTAGAGHPTERLKVLEANVDDLDPRVWPEVIAELMAAGAADAWLTPMTMKKGRPAHVLSVLCAPDLRNTLRDKVFAVTTTFGVREHEVARTALDRAWCPVVVHGSTVRVKVSLAPDGTIAHTSTEFEDAAAASRASGLPVRQVLQDALAAATAAGVVPGGRLPHA